MHAFNLAFVPWLSTLAVALAPQQFNVDCGKLTVQRSDPIVAPGAVSGHVHFVVGGTNFKRTETNQDAIDSKQTTCSTSLDKSNYWIPALYVVLSVRAPIKRSIGPSLRLR